MTTPHSNSPPAAAQPEQPQWIEEEERETSIIFKHLPAPEPSQWITGDRVNAVGMYWHVPPYRGVMPQLEWVILFDEQFSTQYGVTLKSGDGWWMPCVAPEPPTIEQVRKDVMT